MQDIRAVVELVCYTNVCSDLKFVNSL